NQNQTNPYMPVSGETKDHIPVSEPPQEQYNYTESWMNQNATQLGTMQFNSNPYIPPKSTGLGFSVAGMICGILSMMACIFMVFDLLLAIPGLVFSIISLAKKYDGKGMAVAGVICSACGAVLSIGFMWLCLSF
ncbi:MAG TPA: DUF4190 domain-containing protein, partial [Lachnospiraceae bacterium]|nr:DUF4190 domain-containing protein [Lachnospiraceae bacterium]